MFHFHRFEKPLVADELIQSSNDTSDTFLNLGAQLRTPESWPWKLVIALMIFRFLQGKEDKKIF